MSDRTPRRRRRRDKPSDGREARTLYRHPLAAVGGALFVAGVMSFALLLARDLTAPDENPYRSLVTFVAIPAVIGVGIALFLLAVKLQVRAARKRGEVVRFTLRVEPTDPHYMRNLWLFLGLSLGVVLLVGFVGVKGYEATDSVAFCGSCHEVMSPQAETHKTSAHANVSCVECHIGSGGIPYIEAKINGIRQLYATLTDSYERPIPTPFDMRPTAETCEECHWRDNLFGNKIITESYYSMDEDNSTWTISLILDIGGNSERTGQPGGIHWHMVGDREIEYIAEDDARQDISWIRVTEPDGSVRTYFEPGETIPDLDSTEIRRFDCLDCHNRPSHTFEPAPESLNNALSTGTLSLALPEVKDIGLQLLLTDYPDRETAHKTIPGALEAFYAAEYPDVAGELTEEIRQTASGLLAIYDATFFPEMRTDYRVRQYNLGHLNWEGCFRCHDGVKADPSGEVISKECNLCHLIIAQGPTANPVELTSDLGGLNFEHPFGILRWKQRSCASCHAADAGYETAAP